MRSKYLTPTEVNTIRNHLPEEWWLPLWVALETGLRVGDVVALRVRNIHPDGIHYRAAKTRKNGVAPISADLRRRLPRKGLWIFPSPRDGKKHLSRQTVWNHIKQAAKAAGLDADGVSPHAMRKSFAVELYREKGFKAVQAALQHRNSATTEIYSFADWNTGANAEKPLLRRDLQLVVKMVLEALGDTRIVEPESRKRKKKKGD